jgi:hypothetical protein
LSLLVQPMARIAAATDAPDGTRRRSSRFVERRMTMARITPPDLWRSSQGTILRKNWLEYAVARFGHRLAAIGY